MKLHFLGANRQVTGSRYCLETSRCRVMIDCGLFQEREYLTRNWDVCPIPPDSLNAMLLTHAHIDHSGLIPRLVKQGFSGPIFATHATCDLAEIMLLDSARIQQEDAEYKQKRHDREHRTSKYPPQALYQEDDVRDALRLFQPVAYDAAVEVAAGVQVVMRDAGHILGSAMLEVRVEDQGSAWRVVFSGDIGQWNKPILRDPSLVHAADLLVMESTYGDRNHQDAGPVQEQLATIANRTLRRGGKLVIPTFAVERAQELMYQFSRMVHDDAIPDVPIFLDSPMAVDVTEVFRRYADLYDAETGKLLLDKEPPLRFPGLKFVRKSKDSRAINEYKGPCIIMSTSGMCTSGRIKHHLRQTIEDQRHTVLFVGYQSQGTLGRLLKDGAKRVRIHGRQYTVRAEIAQIYGFSGHADQRQLLQWAQGFENRPEHVFLTHGEEDSALALAALLRDRFHWDPLVPEYGSVAELT